ncbi:MAG TPA: hypothetical protein VGW78_02545 [Candidatus Babeliales bacterium]|jgi:hypothetical protein|nr:hypothetical protein [Candidatus Babeliales bacterium]
MYILYGLLILSSISLYSMFDESDINTRLSNANECVERYSSQIPNFSPQMVANNHTIAILALPPLPNEKRLYNPQLHLIKRIEKNIYSLQHTNNTVFGRRGIALDDNRIYVSTENNHIAVLHMHSYAQRALIPLIPGCGNISGLSKNKNNDTKIAASVSAWDPKQFREYSYIMDIDLTTPTTNTKIYNPYCVAHITNDPTEQCIASQSWKNICTIADRRTGKIEMAWHDAKAERDLFPDSITYDPSGTIILSARHTKNKDTGYFSIFDIRNKKTSTYFEKSIMAPFFINNTLMSVANKKDNSFQILKTTQNSLEGVGIIKPFTAIEWDQTVFNSNKSELIGKVKNNPCALVTCTF